MNKDMQKSLSEQGLFAICDLDQVYLLGFICIVYKLLSLIFVNENKKFEMIINCCRFLLT